MKIQLSRTELNDLDTDEIPGVVDYAITQYEGRDFDDRIQQFQYIIDGITVEISD